MPSFTLPLFWDCRVLRAVRVFTKPWNLPILFMIFFHSWFTISSIIISSGKIKPWKELFQSVKMFKHKKYVLVNLMVINFGSNCSVKTQKLLRFQAHGTTELQHSVLEWIWIKGSYLSQWLPQGERWPPKESKSWWIEILHGGSH